VSSAVYELAAGELLTDEQYSLGGGGGTEFKPVFDYVEENAIDPTVLLYYTDGENSDVHALREMAEPGYPVVWISTLLGEDNFPFGQVVMRNQN
jgi:predicted metal-dependent peptidase